MDRQRLVKVSGLSEHIWKGSSLQQCGAYLHLDCNQDGVEVHSQFLVQHQPCQRQGAESEREERFNKSAVILMGFFQTI